jgi:hypothetical protein
MMSKLRSRPFRREISGGSLGTGSLTAAFSPPMPPGLRAHFLDNLELYLTGVGLVLTLTIPMLLGSAHFWPAFGVVALAISVVHGFLFWTVRRRQRRVRAELLTEVRVMLKDRINNQLQVLFDKAISLRLDTHSNGGDPTAAQIADVFEATRAVARTVDQLSLEGLTSWKDRYANVQPVPRGD